MKESDTYNLKILKPIFCLPWMRQLIFRVKTEILQSRLLNIGTVPVLRR